MEEKDFLGAFIQDKVNASQKYFLADKNMYWDKPAVKDLFNNDETLFNKTYETAQQKFAQQANEYSQLKIADKINTYQIDDRLMLPVLGTNLQVKPYTVNVKELKPEEYSDEIWKGQEKGFSGGESWSKPKNTLSEIAKTNKFLKADGTFSNYSAVSDFNPFGYVKVLARKSDGTLDLKDGKPYYKEISATTNPEQIKEDDVLKWNNSFIFAAPLIRDVVGSDMVEKSVTGSFIYNGIKLASMFNPYTRAITLAMELPSFIGAGANLYRSASEVVDKASMSLFNYNENTKKEWAKQSPLMNTIINYGNLFELGTSEYGKQNFWSAENVLNTVGEIGTQLGTMRAFAEGGGLFAAYKYTNQARKIDNSLDVIKNVVKEQNGKLGLGISLNNLASNFDDFAKQLKLVDKDIDGRTFTYFTSDKLKEIENAYNTVSKSFAKTLEGFINFNKKLFQVNEDYIKAGSKLGYNYMLLTSINDIKSEFKNAGFNELESSLAHVLAYGAFRTLFKTDIGSWALKTLNFDDQRNIIKNAVRNSFIGNKFSAPLAKKNAESSFAKAYNYLSKGHVSDFNLVGLGAAGAAEALEEVSEVGIESAIKGLYNGLTNLGVFKPKTIGTPFKFENIENELLMSALGGALGGAIAKKAFQRNFPKDENLIDLVSQGKEDEILSEIDNISKQGLFPTQLNEKGELSDVASSLNTVVTDSMKGYVKALVGLREGLKVERDDFKNQLTTFKDLGQFNNLYDGVVQKGQDLFKEAAELLSNNDLNKEEKSEKIEEIKKQIDKLKIDEKVIGETIYESLLTKELLNFVKNDIEVKEATKILKGIKSDKDYLKDLLELEQTKNDFKVSLETVKNLENVNLDDLIKIEEIKTNLENLFAQLKDVDLEDDENIYFPEDKNTILEEIEKIAPTFIFKDEQGYNKQSFYAIQKGIENIQKYIDSKNKLETLNKKLNGEEFMELYFQEVQRDNNTLTYGLSDTTVENKLAVLQNLIKPLIYLQRLTQYNKGFNDRIGKFFNVKKELFVEDVDKIETIDIFENRLNSLIETYKNNQTSVKEKINHYEALSLIDIFSVLNDLGVTIPESSKLEIGNTNGKMYKNEDLLLFRKDLFIIINDLKTNQGSSNLAKRYYEKLKKLDVKDSDRLMISHLPLLTMIDRMVNNADDKSINYFLEVLNSLDLDKDKFILPSQFNTLLQAYLFATTNNVNLSDIKNNDKINNNVLFLRGVFGSGKGVISKYLKNMLELFNEESKKPKKIIYVAPNENVKNNFANQLGIESKDIIVLNNTKEISHKDIDNEDALFIMDEGTFLNLDSVLNKKSKFILIGDHAQQGIEGNTVTKQTTFITDAVIELTSPINYSVRSGVPDIYRQLEFFIKLFNAEYKKPEFTELYTLLSDDLLLFSKEFNDLNNIDKITPQPNYYIDKNEVKGFKVSYDESKINDLILELKSKNALENFVKDLIIITDNPDSVKVAEIIKKKLENENIQDSNIRIINNNDVQGSQAKNVINLSFYNQSIPSELSLGAGLAFVQKAGTTISRSVNFHYLIINQNFPINYSENTLNSKVSPEYSSFLTDKEFKKTSRDSFNQSLSNNTVVEKDKEVKSEVAKIQDDKKKDEELVREIVNSIPKIPENIVEIKTDVKKEIVLSTEKQIEKTKEEIEQLTLNLFLLNNQDKIVIINGIEGKLNIVNENRIEVETDSSIYELTLSQIENYQIKEEVKENKVGKYKITNLSESQVTVNNINYKINIDKNGNIDSLTPLNNLEQKIKNKELVVAVEIERNKLEINNLPQTTVSEFLSKNNAEKLNILLDNIYNINYTDIIDSGLEKLYNNLELDENEKLQVSLWLQDSFERISNLFNGNNTKEENELLTNAFDNLEIILSLLYNLPLKETTKQEKNEKTNNVRKTEVDDTSVRVEKQIVNDEKIKQVEKKLEEKNKELSNLTNLDVNFPTEENKTNFDIENKKLDVERRRLKELTNIEITFDYVPEWNEYKLYIAEVDGNKNRLVIENENNLFTFSEILKQNVPDDFRKYLKNIQEEVDKINAKYDAELRALENKKTKEKPVEKSESKLSPEELEKSITTIIEKVKKNESLNPIEQDLFNSLSEEYKSKIEERRPKPEPVSATIKEGNQGKASISSNPDFLSPKQKKIIESLFNNDVQLYFTFARNVWIVIDKYARQETFDLKTTVKNLFKDLPLEKREKERLTVLATDLINLLKNNKDYENNPALFVTFEKRNSFTWIVINIKDSKGDYFPIAKFDYYEEQTKNIQQYYKEFYEKVKEKSFDTDSVYLLPLSEFDVTDEQRKENIFRLTKIVSGLSIISKADGKTNMNLADFKENFKYLGVSKVFTLKSDLFYNDEKGNEIILTDNSKGEEESYKSKAMIFMSSNQNLTTDDTFIGAIGENIGRLIHEQKLTLAYAELKPIPILVSTSENKIPNNLFRKYIDLVFDELLSKTAIKQKGETSDALRWLLYEKNQFKFIKYLKKAMGDGENSLFGILDLSNFPDEVDGIPTTKDKSSFKLATKGEIDLEHRDDYRTILHIVLTMLNNSKFDYNVPQEITLSERVEDLKQKIIQLYVDNAKPDEVIHLTVGGDFEENKNNYFVEPNMPESVVKMYGLNDENYENRDTREKFIDSLFTIKGSYSYGKIFFDVSKLTPMKAEIEQKQIIPEQAKSVEPIEQKVNVDNLSIYQKLFFDYAPDDKNEVLLSSLSFNKEYEDMIKKLKEYDKETGNNRWQDKEIEQLFNVESVYKMNQEKLNQFHQDILDAALKLDEKGNNLGAINLVELADKLNSKIIKLTC